MSLAGLASQLTWLDWAVLLALLAFVAAGMGRGFLLGALDLAGMVVSLGAAVLGYRQLAPLLMQHLGCYHAAAMDGGTSTAMSIGGRIIATPGRKLTNLLVIYASRQRYERAMPHLVPPRRHAAMGQAPAR